MAGMDEAAASWEDPATLREWPGNPRPLSDAAVRAVAASIERFGFAAPIVARAEDREVIAGHARLAAARQLALPRVPVRFVDVSRSEAHALACADNRLVELRGWDERQLAEVLAEVAAAGSADNLGWNAGDVERLLTPIAAGEEPPAPDVNQPSPSRARLGDVWACGEHRIACGDSTDAGVWAAALGGRRAQLVVTDPPYGVNYDASWRDDALLGAGRNIGKVKNDDRAAWPEVFAHARSAGCGVAYAWLAGTTIDAVVAAVRQSFAQVRALISWVKPSLVISRGHYHHRCEYLVYAVASGASARWIGGRKQTNVWEIAMEPRADRTSHSTQKPIECMARPIRNHGKRGDVVVDPFLGSGTTLVACEQLGRACVGIELNPAYVDEALGRWERFTGKAADRVVAGA